MRWITDQAIFEEVLTKARACEVADASGEVRSMEVLHFESTELVTRAFFQFVKSLLVRGDDDFAYYLTLDPDPIECFATFAIYPLVELKSSDSNDDYIAAFNAEIGNNPTNALGTNWWKYVVMPNSQRWFIVGTRDFSNDTNGHIWCPGDWFRWIKTDYPSAIKE